MPDRPTASETGMMAPEVSGLAIERTGFATVILTVISKRTPPRARGCA